MMLFQNGHPSADSTAVVPWPLALRATWRRLGNAVLAVAALAASCSAGCARSVVRIEDGSTRVERSISPRAYATYARARLQERAGDSLGAVASYLEVLQLDSSADEAWIRLGALSCQRDLTAANRAFGRAERLNAQSAALFHAKALCSLRHHDFAAALSSADAALRLAPSDPEHDRLVIRIQQARGDQKEAERYAWAHVAVFPNDTAGWLMLAELMAARASLLAQVQHRAAEHLVSQFSYSTFPDTSTRQNAPVRLDLSSKSRVELEHALATSERRLAQRAARELGLGIVELMSLAYRQGARDFASELANLAGQLQPEDLGIWLRRLELADWARDDVAFDRLLRLAPANLSGTSAIEEGPLLELISRRTGVQLATKPGD